MPEHDLLTLRRVRPSTRLGDRLLVGLLTLRCVRLMVGLPTRRRVRMPTRLRCVRLLVGPLTLRCDRLMVGLLTLQRVRMPTRLTCVRLLVGALTLRCVRLMVGLLTLRRVRMPTRRGCVRLVVGLLVAGGGVLLGAAPAGAHATLTSSSPADGAVVAVVPAAVRLTFDQQVEPVRADMQVIDPSGHGVVERAVADGPSVVLTLRPGRARQGTYTVSWRVISADSHPVTGSISFSVGHPSRAVRPPATTGDLLVTALFAVARLLAYAGFALVIGVPAFAWYGWPGLLAHRSARLLVVAGWTALAFGTFGALLLAGPYGAGSGLRSVLSAGGLDQTSHTAEGRALTYRILLVGALPLLVCYALTRLGSAARTARTAFAAAGTAVAAGLAATWSAAGHPATDADPWLAVPADIAHLCAMALWLGGLTAVAVTLHTAPAAARTTAVRRFSTAAAWSVAVLVATGTYQAWLRVREWQALWSTQYGLTLLVKLATVTAVLTVAAFSRRAVRHAVLHEVQHEVQGNAQHTVQHEVQHEVRGRVQGHAIGPRLGRLVLTETALALAVLAVTVALVEMEPAATALTQRPATRTARYDTGGPGGTGRVLLRLPDQARGLTNATVLVETPAGTPRDVPELDVAWSLPGRSIGPIQAVLTRLSTGRYSAETPPLTVPGHWEIAVTVRTDPIDETTVRLKVTLR